VGVFPLSVRDIQIEFTFITFQAFLNKDAIKKIEKQANKQTNKQSKQQQKKTNTVGTNSQHLLNTSCKEIL